MIRIVIPPHTKLPIHKHAVYNAVYCTRGNMIISTKDGELKVSAGMGL